MCLQTYNYIVPKFTKDKQEFILQAYEETRSYKLAARAVHVDSRTVKKIVMKMKAGLKPLLATDSIGPNSSRNHVGSEQSEPESNLRIEVFREFEKGSTNVAVCLESKLTPDFILNYRAEYNSLKKADIDADLEGKKKAIADLDQGIQERGEEFRNLDEGVKGRQETLNDLDRGISGLTSRKTELEHTVDDLLQKEERLTTSEPDISGFIKRMEKMPDQDLYKFCSPLLKSGLFRRGMGEVTTHLVLYAIVYHPNVVSVLDKIQKAEERVSDMAGETVLGTQSEDFEILVNLVKEHAPMLAITWAGRNKKRNRSQAQ